MSAEWLEDAAEVAHARALAVLLEDGVIESEAEMWVEDDGGCYRYTDAAQDEFIRQIDAIGGDL